MDYEIITTFQTTANQKAMLKHFCKQIVSTNNFVSVRARFTDDKIFSLTIFANKPKIYFGVYSSETREIVEDYSISEEQLKKLLEVLLIKHDHATTRKPPVVNKELVFAWMNYFNRCAAGMANSYIV